MSVRGFGTRVPHHMQTRSSPLVRRISGKQNGPILTYARGECNGFYRIFVIQETNTVSFMTWIATMNNHEEPSM